MVALANLTVPAAGIGVLAPRVADSVTQWL